MHHQRCPKPHPLARHNSDPRSGRVLGHIIIMLHQLCSHPANPANCNLNKNPPPERPRRRNNHPERNNVIVPAAPKNGDSVILERRNTVVIPHIVKRKRKLPAINRRGVVVWV